MSKQEKIRFHLTTQEARHTNSCCFTLAARREDGNPRGVPPHEIKTAIERQLFEAGKWRKELRQLSNRTKESTQKTIFASYEGMMLPTSNRTKMFHVKQFGTIDAQNV